jgi:hypothetical protein
MVRTGPTLAADFDDRRAAGGGLASITLPIGTRRRRGDCLQSSNQVVREMARQCDGGHRAMHNLPDWAVSITAVAVGLSPGLVLFIRGSRQPIGSVVEGSSYEHPHWPSSLMGT